MARAGGSRSEGVAAGRRGGSAGAATTASATAAASAAPPVPTRARRGECYGPAAARAADLGAARACVPRLRCAARDGVAELAGRRRARLGASPLKVMLPADDAQCRRPPRRESGSEAASAATAEAVDAAAGSRHRRRRPRLRRRPAKRPRPRPRRRRPNANAGNRRIRQAGRRITGDEAAADQARVRDHALRRALRVGIRARARRRHYLSQTLEHQGELLVALRRGRARGARQRDRAAERSGADRRNRRQLPELRRDRADRHRPRRTGARQRLRVPGRDADARPDS